MTAGIVGLGLIGGSLAKAYHEAGERVLAHDIDRDVLSFAVISGAVDEALTDETMAECDVILLAVRPAAAVEWLKNHAAKIDKHTVVIDCCGTKRKVCAACFPIAEQYGITYLGGHPMAGTQFSGFKYAKANLFVGAPMVLVPPRFDDPNSKWRRPTRPATAVRASYCTSRKMRWSMPRSRRSKVC